MATGIAEHKNERAKECSAETLSRVLVSRRLARRLFPLFRRAFKTISGHILTAGKREKEIPAAWKRLLTHLLPVLIKGIIPQEPPEIS